MPSLLPMVPFLAVVLVPLLAPAGATAQVERRPGSPNPNASGLLSISPGRVEEDVQPGVRTVLRVELTADSERPIDVSLRATDIGAASDPRSVAAQVEDGEFGAGDWLTPEITDLRIKPFETVEFDVVVNPPVEAPVGTNLAGLVVDSTIASGAIGTADSAASFRVEGLLQIFLTVPGAVEHDLRISDIDLRDSVILGGQRFAVWDVTFRNAGTVNEHVTGTARVRSLFGNSAYSVPVQNLLVLRGSSRKTRVVWRDLPWVGAFALHVRARGDDARQIEGSSERLYVMPWWLPVLIAASVLGPLLWIWIRRRREWMLYLEDEDDLLVEDWNDEPPPA